MGIASPKLYDASLNLTGGPAMAASPLSGEALGALRRREVIAAVSAAERLAAEFPNELHAHALKAFALVEKVRSLGTSPEAMASFEEALSRMDGLDPGNPYSTYARARMITFRGEGGEGALAVGHPAGGGHAKEGARLLGGTAARLGLVVGVARQRVGHVDGVQALARPAVALEAPQRGQPQRGGVAVAVHEDDGRHGVEGRATGAAGQRQARRAGGGHQQGPAFG